MRKDDQELIEPLHKHKFDLVKLEKWMNSIHEEVKKVYDNAYTTNRSRYLLNKHDPFLIPRVDMGKKLNNFKIDCNQNPGKKYAIVINSMKD